MQVTRLLYQLKDGDKIKIRSRHGKLFFTSDELTFAYSTEPRRLWFKGHNSSYQLDSDDVILVDIELPTEEGSYILLDEYTPAHVMIPKGTLAQLNYGKFGEAFWHFFDKNMGANAIEPARITNWRPVTITAN